MLFSKFRFMKVSRHIRCSSNSKGCANRRAFFFGQTIQLKSATDYANDGYEQEADDISQKIASTGGNSFFKGSGSIQTKKFSSSIEKSNGANHGIISNGGHSLDSSTRNFMEPKFGYDFSKVKIHNDSAAHQSATDMNARAYTHGNNIVFGAGQYQPGTQAGKQLLAHELTHVVQQNGIPSAVQRKPLFDDVTPANRFEDDIDQFQKDYGIKVVFAGYVKTQKEPLIAKKDGDIIKVTMGPDYFNEADEQVRKAWIKAEIIAKFVKRDRFEELANDPTHAKLHELNPPHAAGAYCNLNCPATAESLAEYLKTGKVNKAECDPMAESEPGYGFDVSSLNTYTKPLPWPETESAIRKLLVNHGDFVVVEATRSEKQMKDLGISKNHYFTVLNVKGKLFAIDASQGGIVNSDLQQFINLNIVATTYRMAKGDFKVKSVRPTIKH